MFPVGVDYERYYQVAKGEGFHNAIQTGNLDFVKRVEEEFGGMFYCKTIAEKILKYGHVEFFIQYVLLCRRSLLVIDESVAEEYEFVFPVTDIMSSGVNAIADEHVYISDEGYYVSLNDEPDEDFSRNSWARARDEVLIDAINCKLPPQDRFHLILDLIDNIFPQFPPADEIEFPVGAEICDQICTYPKYPLWTDPDYPNIIQMEIDTLMQNCTFGLDRFDLLKHLCEVKGWKFNSISIYSIHTTRYMDIVEFILQHVDQSVDIDEFRDCVPEIRSEDFLSELRESMDNMTKYQWDRTQVKDFFMRIFYRRGELIRRALFVVQFLHVIIEGNPIDWARASHSQLTIMNTIFDEPIDIPPEQWNIPGQAQAYLDFLMDVLDEVISENISEPPASNFKVRELRPDEIAQYAMALMPEDQ